jgi:type IV secretion system protein VirD4
MTNEQAQVWLVILAVIGIIVSIYRRKRWRPSGNAHGTASWCTETDMRAAAMFGLVGLILGRTARGDKVIRLPRYCHLSVFAPTGAGKGVSFVLSTLLSYRGSIFCFDPKGENYRLTFKHRQSMGQRVIRIDPFNVCGPGGDSFNPLAEIAPDDPQLIDSARALAEAMVIRQPDERDPFWANSAVNLLTAMIVVTLLAMKESDRNLSTVRELLTDPDLFKESIARLRALGGVPARLGGMLAKQSESEKEMSGVLSTANTHTSFLDSTLIAQAVNASTFSADVLLEPGTTIYFILPTGQLDAQKNFLRLAVSSLLRHVMRHGVRNGGEVLFLLDECASFASGLESLEQAFQLGRGSGLRLMTFFQTVEQAQAAFKSKPNLVLDNSDKVFFGVNSFPTADLVSKMLGNWTMPTSTFNETASGGSSYSPDAPGGGRNRQRNWSQSTTAAEHGRALLDAAEVMRLDPLYFIAFFNGMPPILGRRILYYADPLFHPHKNDTTLFWIALFLFVILLAWLFSTV